MALPNGDLITTVFDPQMAYPVDKRMQVDTLNSRDSISMFIRWEGMTVYVLENSKIYILQGGRSNEFWKELGTGSGTGGTTFVGQFPTADLLPTSGRSAGDYAFVGTGDDFVQYNWDNIANKWVMAEGQTDMASEFFHIGYKTPLRRPVIFPLFPKDVLVQESGDFVFAPETAVARFIFVGEVDEIRGIETAASDREIKLVNRTGSDIPLRDKSSGIPSGSGMDFGGTDYTWVNGTEITLKGNGTYWELAPNNQVAFSDHLDSVNAQVSVGSDGKIVIPNTIGLDGQNVNFRESANWFDGTPMTDGKVDGIIWQKINNKYLFASDIYNNAINIERFRVAGDSDHDVIQKAFNFVGSSKASFAQFSLRIPSGKIYEIDKPLLLNTYSDVDIVGDGIMKSYIRATAPMTEMIKLGIETETPFRGRCNIQGLTLNGAGLADCIIDARGIRYSSIKYNQLAGLAENGIAIKCGGWVNEVHRNLINNFNGVANLTGIRVYNTGNSNKFIITNNSISTHHVGLHIDDFGNSITVDCNTFDVCAGAGIYLSRGARGIGIRDNYFERCGDVGLDITKGAPGSAIERWTGAIIAHHHYGSANTWINGLVIKENQFAMCGNTTGPLITLSGLNQCVVENNFSYYGTNNKYFVELKWQGSQFTTGNNVIIDHTPANASQFEQLVGLNADNQNGHCNLVIRERTTNGYTRSYSLPSWNNPFVWNKDTPFKKFHEEGESYRGNAVLNYRGDATDVPQVLEIPVTSTISGKYFRVNWFTRRDAVGSATSFRLLYKVDGVTVNTFTSSASENWSSGGFSSAIYVPSTATTISFTFDHINSAQKYLSGFSITPANNDLFEENTLKPSRLTGQPYLVAGTPESFQKAPKGRIAIDAVSGEVYRKTTDYETTTGWVNITPQDATFLQKGLLRLAGDTETRDGLDSTIAVPPLHLKTNYEQKRLDSVISSTSMTLTVGLNNRYTRFTGDAGNITVPPDTFTSRNVVIGEIEGGAKTFVAGTGVTLRYPDGQGLVAPTGSRFIIKFKSPNDALVTIIKPYTSTVPNSSTTQRGIIEQATDAEIKTGTDTERSVDPKGLKDNYLSFAERDISSTGTVAITPLAYSVKEEVITFTASGTVNLNGFNAGVEDGVKTFVNKTGNNLTCVDGAAVTVPFAEEFIIPNNQSARFRVSSNLLLKEL